MNEIRLYFDLVSPYVFLALQRVTGFAAEHGVRFVPRPVVYGAILDRTGLVGPVEVPAKRHYTFVDIRRCADLLDLTLVGPPTHPFRSLEALRAICLQPPEQALRLAVALSRACWSEGRDISRLETIAAVMQRLELDTGDLPRRLSDPEVKAALADATQEAIDAGVFGVPTFRLGDELFWGHDRMDHLAARLHRDPAPPDCEVQRMLSRPAGAVRRGAPGSKATGS